MNWLNSFNIDRNNLPKPPKKKLGKDEKKKSKDDLLNEAIEKWKKTKLLLLKLLL